MPNLVTVPSTYGPIAMIWSIKDGAPKLNRILIPKLGHSIEQQVSELYTEITKSSCKEIDRVAGSIQKLLNGEKAVVLEELMDLSQCSEFRKRILQTVHQIPLGEVSSYQLIAQQSGCENGARAAGTAMADNPFPLIIPCHRILKSDGHLGNYQGGLNMKRDLLKKEGVHFDRTDRLLNPSLYYSS